MKSAYASGMPGPAAFTRLTALTAIAAAVALLASPAAMADDAGWYGGANVGQSRAKIDDARITSSLLGRGFATNSISDDDRNTGYKVFGGYQFNNNFALEGGYFDLGRFGYRATTTPAGSLSGNIRLRGVNLDAVGTLPLTEKLSAIGRIGVNYAEAKDSFAGTGLVNVSNPNPSARGTNLKFGAGLQYAFTDALALRAEAERYRINDAVGNRGNVDLISIGLVYRFGAKSSAPQTMIIHPAEPMPQPIAAVPAPVVIAPAPAPRKVSFSADSLFDFNKSSVKPTGKQALDKFAADLKGTSFDVIQVTGHADRIGSHASNLKLSASRADAVKSYLAESANIPAAMIAAKGVDGAEPVTKPGECKWTKPTPKLIACLQPDRRVEVEVSGTR